MAGLDTRHKASIHRHTHGMDAAGVHAHRMEAQHHCQCVTRWRTTETLYIVAWHSVVRVAIVAAVLCIAVYG